MKLDTIYVIHHTHTDIGFTNDQPIFLGDAIPIWKSNGIVVGL